MDEISNIELFFEEWGLSFNARTKFNDFLDAIVTNQELLDECQKIYSIIDDIVLNKEADSFIRKLEKGSTYYRARIIEPADDANIEKGIGRTYDNKFIGYNEVNSREPMIGISGEGRNNTTGSSYLYMASNPETACMEIKSQFGSLLSLAKFETIEELTIFDFSTEKTFQREDSRVHNLSLGVFFSLLMGQYTTPVSNSKEYKATQIISDYLRKTGIDGIAYKSFLSPGGVNYTIFNCHPSKIKFCDSRVLIHKQANHSFWDFNNKSEILSNPNMKYMEYNEDIAKKHKEHLSQRFKIISNK